MSVARDHLFERNGHVVDRPNAIIGPLGEAPGYQLFQFGGESCAERLHLCWLIAKDRSQDLGRGVARKSTAASRHFVENAAQREDVAAFVGDVAALPAPGTCSPRCP